jgi:hypothetical protein
MSNDQRIFPACPWCRAIPVLHPSEILADEYMVIKHAPDCYLALDEVLTVMDQEAVTAWCALRNTTTAPHLCLVTCRGLSACTLDHQCVLPPFHQSVHQFKDHEPRETFGTVQVVEHDGWQQLAKEKTGYCWKCADEFPMSELIEDDDPYIKDETDPRDKNYQCKKCAEGDD